MKKFKYRNQKLGFRIYKSRAVKMKRRDKLGILLAVGVLGLLICTGWISSSMEELGQTVSVYFAEASLTDQDFNRLMEYQTKKTGLKKVEETQSSSIEDTEQVNPVYALDILSAFQRLEQESISIPLGKSAAVTLYRIQGDGKAAMPMPYVKGNALLLKDTSGCVLDIKTAYELFGSLDILGKSILLDGNSYYIRGILEADEPMVLIRSQVQSSSQVPVYSHLELRMERLNDSSTILSFLNQCQIGDPKILINSVVIWQGMKGIVWLPVWILFISMVLKGITMIDRWSFSDGKVAFLIGGTAFLALVYGHFPNPLPLVADNIPSQWSDFLFFRSRWKELGDWLDQISRMQRLPKDAECIKLWVWCSVLTGAALLLAAAAGICMQNPGRRKNCETEQKNETPNIRL